jgi:hypothetical protein
MKESTFRVHVDQFDVADCLRSLGLDVGILLDAVRAGYHAWDSCTGLDPKMFPGQAMWAVTVRRLRQLLVPKGWSCCDDGNYPLVLSPTREVAVSVATGNEGTGLKNSMPTTQSPKGPRTIDAVVVNNAQLGLELPFPDGYQPRERGVDENPTYTTWLLLIHRVGDGAEIRAELSHPLSFDENQHVAGWRERIILPTVEFEPDGFELDQDEESDIEISVRRRV